MNLVLSPLLLGLLAVLLLLVFVAAAGFVGHVRGFVRGADDLAARWRAAAASPRPCAAAPPAPSCVFPPQSPPPTLEGDAFQDEAAFFFLTTSSAMVTVAKGGAPRLRLPGVSPASVTEMGTAAYPLFACSFVAGDTRFVVFRGTSDLADLLYIDFSLQGPPASARGVALSLLRGGEPSVMSFPQTSVSFGGAPARVHSGFWGAYLRYVRDPLFLLLKGDPPSVQKLCVGGHSMGASVAQLCAVDLATQPGGREVYLYALASTRVGDPAFARLVRATPGLRAFNVKNTEDPIPDGIPPVAPDFSSPDQGAMLNYETSGEVISITAHAPTLELCHFTPSYHAGLAARAARARGGGGEI